MSCPICSSSVSKPIQELFGLPTVTSDCRSWSIGKSVTICSQCGVLHRVINDDFSNNVYSKYISYPEPTGRTEKILKYIDNKMPLPQTVLDIGSGAGYGLKVLGDHYPQAAVFGFEPHGDTLHTIRENVTILSERPIEKKFDLITLFHVFEHVNDPHELLQYVRMALSDRGRLLIQVPNVSEWPFDLIIADHVWHFNIISLMHMLSECGFSYQKCGEIGGGSFGNNPIKKEITIFAVKGNEEEFILPGKKSNQINFHHQSVDFILHYKKFLDGIKERVSVYGTGPAAAWVAGILGDKVQCFIDDDVRRVGVKFQGKSVFSPAWVDPGNSVHNLLPIVAPFPAWQMQEIKSKNSKLKFLEP